MKRPLLNIKNIMCNPKKTLNLKNLELIDTNCEALLEYLKDNEALK